MQKLELKTSSSLKANEANEAKSWRVKLKANEANKLMKLDAGFTLLAASVIVLLLLTSIGLSLVSAGLFEGLMSESGRSSQGALNAAQSGVKDALVRIARNKSFASAGYFLPSACTLNTASVCARIIVEKDAASVCSQAIASGQNCIISTGTVFAVTRVVETILNVNAQNGKITVVTTKEL